MYRQALILVLLSVVTVYCKDHFVEKFDDGEGWKSRWVESTAKGEQQGEFKLSHGKYYGDAKKDLGIQTTPDARFFGLSAKFPSFSNDGKTLVIQFTVKHEQKIDCGGGYIKVYGSDIDQKGLHGDSPYHIMFGPDICGYSTKKVHVIFTYKGKNLLIKKDIKCKDDELTHLYTLILKPDNTYIVKIDNEKVESGKLEEDWDFSAPKTIKDPQASKPSDWDDNEKIDDPADKKPEDWDVSEHVADPEAKKPEDWDDEIDGTWEPPMVDNPDYKGLWKPKQIDNPAYKGAWVHPEIDNPEYSEDPNIYLYKDIAAVGFDLWQVKSGTIFDNVMVTDDEKAAEDFGNETWGKTKEPEKKMKEEQEEAERKKEEAERKKREEEEKSKAPSTPTEDADEDDAADGDEIKSSAHDGDEL